MGVEHFIQMILMCTLGYSEQISNISAHYKVWKYEVLPHWDYLMQKVFEVLYSATNPMGIEP